MADFPRMAPTCPNLEGCLSYLSKEEALDLQQTIQGCTPSSLKTVASTVVDEYVLVWSYPLSNDQMNGGPTPLLWPDSRWL